MDKISTPYQSPSVTCLAAVVLAASCQKESIHQEQDNNVPGIDIPSTEAVVFSAVTEGPAVKTGFAPDGNGSYTVLWQASVDILSRRALHPARMSR